jgi:hypothetical protein
MAKIALTTGLLLVAILTYAQDFEPLFKKLQTLKTFSEFDSVDREILLVCDYVLSQPLMREKQTKNYQYAVKCMVKWMNNTESYRILIFGKVIESTQGDPLMQNMFMASMGKYLLEQRYNHNRHVFPVKQPNVNYGDLPEVRETLLEGAKIFFDYLKNTSGEKPNKELKNGIKAFNDGALEEYMFKRL